MPSLVACVDYDNVEANLRTAGPVNLAKVLVGTFPALLIDRYDSVEFRLYGGWRYQNALTQIAQAIIPDIRMNSPTVVSTHRNGTLAKTKLEVLLADGPIGWSTPLAESVVRGRSIRNFWSLAGGPPGCRTPSSCGMQSFRNLRNTTSCTDTGCSIELGDMLVRDEQKMVDTLIVADMAYVAYGRKAHDIVLVSSDNDMWPGVLVAIRAGCFVTHIHTKVGRRTPRHLLQTLGGPLEHFYAQVHV